MSKLYASHTLPGGQVIEIAQGDLTLEPLDAIVNAANEHLAHGGGIAAAILRRGGDVIQRESDAWVQLHGPVSHERPAYTSAGSIPARFVIHAVGPIWGTGDEDAKLAAAVTGSLETATELELRSIAIPAISTGIFGFPKQRAAPVMLSAVFAFFARSEPTSLALIRFVLYDSDTLAIFVRALAALS